VEGKASGAAIHAEDVATRLRLEDGGAVNRGKRISAIVVDSTLGTASWNGFCCGG